MAGTSAIHVSALLSTRHCILLYAKTLQCTSHHSRLQLVFIVVRYKCNNSVECTASPHGAKPDIESSGIAYTQLVC